MKSVTIHPEPSGGGDALDGPTAGTQGTAAPSKKKGEAEFHKNNRKTMLLSNHINDACGEPFCPHYLGVFNGATKPDKILIS